MLDRNTGRIWRWCAAALPGLAALLAAGLIAPAGAARPGAQPAAAPAVLYDGAQGTKPDQQGWFYQALGGSAANTFAGGATTVDTTSSPGVMAGYFASQAGFITSTAPVPVLDRAAGYTLSFVAQVQAEDHTKSDRAGFSVIALSSDKQGIELGFWLDRIWAQEGGAAPKLFTQAEGFAFNTAARLRRYDLTVYSDTYRLSTGCTTILSGKLRDYTAATGVLNPYTTPNLLFFGDDTSSASGRFQLALIQIATATGAGQDPSRCVYLALAQR